MKISLLLIAAFSSQNIGATESLGRLFHTPQQRARLDALRQTNSAVDTGDNPIFMLDGEVRRSSGHDTHWINGESRPGRFSLNSQSKAGDRIDPRSGEQHPLLGDGQLIIRRPPR